MLSKAIDSTRLPSATEAFSLLSHLVRAALGFCVTTEAVGPKIGVQPSLGEQTIGLSDLRSVFVIKLRCLILLINVALSLGWLPPLHFWGS